VSFGSEWSPAHLYSWFKIISIGWALFHHKPLSSFLLYHFFLIFAYYFFVFFPSYLPWFLRFLFIFFIITSLYIPSNKKSASPCPLFLHVLHPCFKIFKCKNFTQFNLPFQIVSILFFLFSSRWIYFPFFLHSVSSYVDVYRILKSSQGGGAGVDPGLSVLPSSCLPLVFARSGSSSLSSFFSLVLSNPYLFSPEAFECLRSHGESFFFKIIP